MHAELERDDVERRLEQVRGQVVREQVRVAVEREERRREARALRVPVPRLRLLDRDLRDVCVAGDKDSDERTDA